MGELFHPSRDEFDLSAVMHALSDPARRKVVATLAAEGERACGTFPLGVTKATASHHFKVLREAGLTMTRVEGAHRFLTLRRDDLDARFPGLLDAVLSAEPAGALA
ncbi:MAG: ArsR/SmtB family transcription factor [Solirubrobacteraceae bacterium]